MNPTQRILIIKPSALGDVATALPLLADLRAKMPDAQIDWLVQPAFAPLLEGHPAIAEIISFDRKELASWWWRPSSFLAFNALLRKLRQKKYDIVIDAQGLFRSGFLAHTTRAKIRVGFANAREGANFFYTRRVTLPDDGKQMVAVDRMCALAAALGCDTSNPAQFDLPIAAEATSHAKEQLNGIENFIAVIPGARWNTKRWPTERYTEIVQKLLDANHPVVLLGSPDEKPLCDEIVSHLQIENQKSKIENLAGRTDLATMVALLAQSKLVLGNDSGPLHIATALGRPVIGLYGPTPPAFVGPYAQLDHVLRHDVPCHPCRLRECGHHSCMQGLRVELVWEKVSTTIPK